MIVNDRLVSYRICSSSEGDTDFAKSGRFELFLDLLYVAILSNFADDLVQDISGAKLAKYIVCRNTEQPIQASCILLGSDG